MPSNQTSTDGTHEPADEHYRPAQFDAVPPGAQVDKSRDGSITSIVTPEGEWRLSVDPSTELGAKIHRIAATRDKTPEQLLHEAAEEFAEEQLED